MQFSCGKRFCSGSSVRTLMQVINQLLTAGLSKNILWSMHLERVQLMNKELPISPSAQAMHLLNSAWRSSFLASCRPVLHCNQKLSSCLLNAFSAPFSLSHFLSHSFSLSNLLVTVRSQPSGTWSVIGVSAVTAYSTAPNDALGRFPRENSISSSHLSVVIIRIFPL